MQFWGRGTRQPFVGLGFDIHRRLGKAHFYQVSDGLRPPYELDEYEPN